MKSSLGKFYVFAPFCKHKLGMVLHLSRACYGVLRFIMESGAKGCEVVVSGKLRGQRAKSMKFVDGLMIHSGDPVNYYVDTAVRHVLLRQGESGEGCTSCHEYLEWNDFIQH